MAFEIKITPEMKRRFQSEVAEHLNNLEKMLMVLEKIPATGRPSIRLSARFTALRGTATMSA